MLEIQMRKCIRLSQMPDMIPDYQMKKQLNHKIQVIKIKYVFKLNKQLRTSQIIVSE